MKKVFQAFPAFAIKLTKSTAEDAALGHFCSNLFHQPAQGNNTATLQSKIPHFEGTII